MACQVTPSLPPSRMYCCVLEAMAAPLPLAGYCNAVSRVGEKVGLLPAPMAMVSPLGITLLVFHTTATE